MLSRQELVSYLDDLLSIHGIKDYAPNGLQIEGTAKITRLVSGVSANRALIDAAIRLKADAILVHHGFFWRGEAATICGLKKQRLQALLQHDINLLAYHLPLDVHPDYGNNYLLCKHCGWQLTRWLKVDSGLPLIGLGQLPAACTAEELSAQLARVLQQEPCVLKAPSNKPIKRLAWCTGAAQDYLSLAAEAGIDAFITGEVSERTTAEARELDVHFYAAGHHATERFGVQAIGQHCAEKFSLEHHFVDIANPI